jgi:hypothetical protein
MPLKQKVKIYATSNPNIRDQADEFKNRAASRHGSPLNETLSKHAEANAQTNHNAVEKVLRLGFGIGSSLSFCLSWAK